MAGWLIVEGHGEVEAAGNLIGRLWGDLGAPYPWGRPRRWPGVHRPAHLSRAAENARADKAQGLLILQDLDDGCPAAAGPDMAAQLAALALPFPAAVVLLHPEFEVLFLPCLPKLAGKPLGAGPSQRPGLKQGATWDLPSWEGRRGVKEWLTRQMPPGRSYKPTLDQLPLTQALDLDLLRAADVPCFGTLERALQFLATGEAGQVYPGR